MTEKTYCSGLTVLALRINFHSNCCNHTNHFWGRDCVLGDHLRVLKVAVLHEKTGIIFPKSNTIFLSKINLTYGGRNQTSYMFMLHHSHSTWSSLCLKTVKTTWETMFSTSNNGKQKLVLSSIFCFFFVTEKRWNACHINYYFSEVRRMNSIPPVKRN